jgi:hypothetical protein
LLESANRLALSDNKQDMAVALANLQEALRRNVASADRWCDLGEALLRLRRIDDARYSFAKGLALGPQNPSVYWRTAQFYAQIQEPRRSQEYMKNLLELMPQYRQFVFEKYVSGRTDVLDALQYGIPQHDQLPQDYLRYVQGQDLAFGDVKRAWHWLLEHSLVDDELTVDYVEFLTKKSEYSQAEEAWQRGVGSRDRAYLKPNLVFNGGFESEPLQSGLDWRFPETPGVHISRDHTVAFSGSSSLQIAFDGESNINFHSVTHAIVASPGHYHFTAHVRTELTTDQGIGFRLLDSSGQINLQTVRLTGTHDWTPVNLDFTVPNPARLLRIELVREPSLKFDNKIKGKAWIDDVSITVTRAASAN